MQPGESTTLTMDFTMHAGMGGPHEFRTPLRTNDAVQPEKVLVVRSAWGP